MKQSLVNLVRTLAVVLMFVPGPLGVVNSPSAMATEEPAVVVPAPGVEETESPWTARFLAPASVVIAAIAIGASASYYIVRIRGRYRVG